MDACPPEGWSEVAESGSSGCARSKNFGSASAEHFIPPGLVGS